MGKMTAGEAYKKGLFKEGVRFTYWNRDDNERRERMVVREPYHDEDGNRDKDLRVDTVELGNTSKRYLYIYNGGDVTVQFDDKQLKTIKTEKGDKNMLEKATSEIKEFLGENKAVFYWFIVIFLVDYYVFHGSFKEKLEGMFGKVIDKVTNMVDGADKAAEEKKPVEEKKEEA